MALRSSQNLLKSIAAGLGGGVSHFTTSTTPKSKAFSPTIGELTKHNDFKARVIKKGDIVPMSVAVGMIILSTSFGIYTATKELRTAPNVFVKKSRRETIPEVVEPEHVLEESEKFIKKSFFRRIAHLRDKSYQEAAADNQLPRIDIFSMPPKAETLKDIGVDPISN
ncbi:OLC1v1014444C1 [Oldenlandia corymbosa var. corymbosa]|uniref:OLC1v1014444C1 n=1 Tax=Oldenlandia corymbosa var. corymbosa TaxID=529605 RepID=A0AAV1E453_OLDCO|nr:OLC1v1014444C1 [Oldenlandia corymbosa var. corymbosa]